MHNQGDIHPEAAVAPGYLANHAARAFNRGVDAALKPHGLTMALIGPLLLLSWKGPLLQRDIVRWSASRQPAMVALLDRLESLALIAREPSPNDRRASLVELTEAGREAAGIGGQALIDGNKRSLEGFSRDEAAHLVVLRGDAAWCATPLAGIGTTLAVTGAYVLAGELHRSDDVAASLKAYDAAMRPMVEDAQNVPKIGPRLMHPRSRLGIHLLHGALGIASRPTVRNLAAKLFAGETKSPDLSTYPKRG